MTGRVDCLLEAFEDVLDRLYADLGHRPQEHPGG